MIAGAAWQFSVDIDYIKSIGGVAKCFNPKTRIGHAGHRRVPRRDGHHRHAGKLCCSADHRRGRRGRRRRPGGAAGAGGAAGSGGRGGAGGNGGGSAGGRRGAGGIAGNGTGGTTATGAAGIGGSAAGAGGGSGGGPTGGGGVTVGSGGGAGTGSGGAAGSTAGTGALGGTTGGGGTANGGSAPAGGGGPGTAGSGVSTGAAGATAGPPRATRPAAAATSRARSPAASERSRLSVCWRSARRPFDAGAARDRGPDTAAATGASEDVIGPRAEPAFVFLIPSRRPGLGPGRAPKKCLPPCRGRAGGSDSLMQAALLAPQNAKETRHEIPSDDERPTWNG